MKWKSSKIYTEDGEVAAQAPVIISASRATDIPAFYSDWFFKRLEAGYAKWKNPFNGVFSYVSFENTRLIVFWSKNPKPIIKNLDYLNSNNINYYFQFTLNDYEYESLEANVGSVDKRIDTFIELSEQIGKEKVIWRFDPYILTKTSGVDELLKRTEYIGNKLKDYTEKLVISFADISLYRKVATNLKKANIEYKEFDEKSMHQLANGLQKLNEKWKFEIATCAEKIDLNMYGIKHNKCVDDDLMIKLFSDDDKLMNFLGVQVSPPNQLFGDTTIKKSDRILKDKGQRQLCGCIISKDIGQYNTCPHDCLYCYANSSPETARANFKKHKQNPYSESILGE